MLPPFLRIQEAAMLLGKSEQTVRRMIRRGDLRAKRMRTAQGFHYLVHGEDLELSPSEARLHPRSEPYMQPKAPIGLPPILAPIPSSVYVPFSVTQPSFWKRPIFKLGGASVPFKAPCLADATQESPEVLHEDKKTFYKILEKLQVELEKERQKPRSLFAYIMDYLLG